MSRRTFEHDPTRVYFFDGDVHAPDGGEVEVYLVQYGEGKHARINLSANSGYGVGITDPDVADVIAETMTNLAAWLRKEREND